MRCFHFILPIVLAAQLTACSPTVPAMTPEETQRINELTAKMTPRCIGRYLIDLPEPFVLNTISTTEIEGVKITVVPMSRAKFDHNLHYREEELRKMHMDGKPMNPFLKKLEATPEGFVGKIFNRVKESGAAEFGRTLELHGWKGGFNIEILLNAIDGTDLVLDPDVVGTIYETASRRILAEYQNENDTPQKLAHLLKIYERLQGLADNEIPTGKGVCFPNGFLSGPPTDEEQIDLYYHLGTVEDVYFGFHYLSGIGPEKETLLQRSKAINESLAQNNGKTLRKGKREVNGLAFEEWLTMQETDPGVKDYDMTLELNSKEGNASKPLLVTDFYSGVRHPRPQPSLEEIALQKPIAKASLGEAESLTIWDKVTSTLRPRPGAF